MEDKQRESFLFYRDWWESLRDNDAIRYEVYDAIMVKVFDDIEPEVSSIANMALKFILPVIGRDNDKYNDVREKRKTASIKGNEKRWGKSQTIANVANATSATPESQTIANVANATSATPESQMSQTIANVANATSATPESQMSQTIANVANIAVNDNINININKNKKETPKGVKKEKEVAASAATPENELEKRAKVFFNTLVPYVSMYGKDMLRQFYDYWTEPNKSRTKMRYELERTWDTKRRLNTWASRENINRRRTNYDTNPEQARQQREQDALNIMRRLAAEDDADEQVR